VKGNIATLARFARLPCPLPLGALKGRRSLLSIDNLVDAIDTVLVAAGSHRRPYIVADAEALTVAEMIAAMRKGLRRRASVFPVPAPILNAALRAAGRPEWNDLLAGSLIADNSALSQLGWTPRVSTTTGLAALMSSGS
jgi:UDP-glucose 4-epimerase